jgi:hypothetical protein
MDLEVEESKIAVELGRERITELHYPYLNSHAVAVAVAIAVNSLFTIRKNKSPRGPIKDSHINFEQSVVSSATAWAGELPVTFEVP